MKKLHPLLSVLFLVSFGFPQSIMSKIQDLEKSVEKLEKDLLEKTDEISKLKKTNNLKSLWRNLNNSLIKEEVKSILGEPDNIHRMEYTTIWYYKYGNYNEGKVKFSTSDGVLKEWIEPNFEGLKLSLFKTSKTDRPTGPINQTGLVIQPGKPTWHSARWAEKRRARLLRKCKENGQCARALACAPWRWRWLGGA